ncbi:MAG: hypothetical protein TRG1_3163 [Flavobacteriaceae bacterium FS1-H7996/R]|nr:MAG: hypothetical protein TRG1_3163 [Flavobacteriaceae bacterium FS1-H7996/R]
MDNYLCIVLKKGVLFQLAVISFSFQSAIWTFNFLTYNF